MSITWTETDLSLNARRDQLLKALRGYGRVAVAFSGGIDSTVVAQAAFDALGDAAVAVTAVSESLAEGELEEASDLAGKIGIRHRVIHTEEFANPNYRQEQPRSLLLSARASSTAGSKSMLAELDADVIASGANLDDMGDYRPGLQAAAEHGVRHPLARVRVHQGRCTSPCACLGAYPPGTNPQPHAFPAELPMARMQLPNATG